MIRTSYQAILAMTVLWLGAWANCYSAQAPAVPVKPPTAADTGVKPPAPAVNPPQATPSVKPPQVLPAVLTWKVHSDGKQLAISPELAVPYTLVRIKKTTEGEYQLVVAAVEGSNAPEIWVDLLKIGGDQPVPPPPPPPDGLIDSFTATPNSIKKGESATVKWATKAKTVTLNGANVAVSGQQVVNPTSTTTYTLVASDGTRTTTAQQVVTVRDEPGPDPTPGPLFVFVLYEANDLDDQPLEQADFLSSKPLRDYIWDKCAKKDGHPQCRFLDEGPDTKAKLTEEWQKIYDRAKNHKDFKLPWLIVTNGKDWYEGPKPQTTQAFLDLLKKYGGQ